jgi:hypothetical protein
VSGEPQDTNSLTLMRKLYASRILAVNIRSRRFGYAVFEMPARFLDCGVSKFGSFRKAERRVAALFRMFRPSAIVLRKVTARNKRNSQRAKRIARIVRRQANRWSIPVTFVSERTLKAFFRRLGRNNKYDIAALVGNRFPEVAWKLPSRRKFYEPEPWAMTSFDAAALGAAYIELQNSNSRPLEIDAVA